MRKEDVYESLQSRPDPGWGASEFQGFEGSATVLDIRGKGADASIQ